MFGFEHEGTSAALESLGQAVAESGRQSYEAAMKRREALLLQTDEVPFLFLFLMY